MNNDMPNPDKKTKKTQHNMLLANGITQAEFKSSSDLKSLDSFLENEKQTNASEPWSKLDKTAKLKKILVYADTYKIEQNLTSEQYIKLVAFFKDCLDKKKLQRVKDVLYDKETGCIKNIPALSFVKGASHFTLKNTDKRVSTIKSLTPKKNNTVKNHVSKEKSDSDDEEAPTIDIVVNANI